MVDAGRIVGTVVTEKIAGVVGTGGTVSIGIVWVGLAAEVVAAADVAGAGEVTV